MNRERILQLADVIEKTPHAQPDYWSEGPLTSFNMSEWRYGTCGCLGGWVEHLFRDEDDLHARDLLDIEGDAAEELFYPTGFTTYKDILPARAARVLRHLAETGKVDWSIA